MVTVSRKRSIAGAKLRIPEAHADQSAGAAGQRLASQMRSAANLRRVRVTIRAYLGFG